MSLANELIRSLLLVLLLASMVAGRGAVAEETVRVGGTGSDSLLMQRLLEGYAKARQGAEISRDASHGKGGGRRALAAGSVQVAVISSSSMPEAAAARITPWISTPLVFTGQNLVTGTQVTTEKVAELYAGRIGQ